MSEEKKNPLLLLNLTKLYFRFSGQMRLSPAQEIQMHFVGHHWPYQLISGQAPLPQTFLTHQ